MNLYRAVGYEEFYELMKTGLLRCAERGIATKYFGLSLDDTLEFANRQINHHVVAVLKFVIEDDILRKYAEFLNVDTKIFKSGTVEIEDANLDFINAEIIEIIHVI